MTSGRKPRRRSSDQNPAARRQMPTVLIVDDDLDARQMYSSYLKSKGCEVFVAPDGAVAVEKAEWLCPDVIVMDLAMPRVDGWAATARLKASSWTRRIPVIVLTAVEMAADAARAAGCDVFLAKPCLPEVLWTHIAAVLEDRIA